MSELRLVGCQEIHTRLLEEGEPLTLDTLFDVSKRMTDRWYSDIVQCDEVYKPYTLTEPHHNMHWAFIHMHTDVLSLTVWQVMHVSTWSSKDSSWHRAYLYKVTSRAPGIQKLTLYELRQVKPGELTYITFEAVDAPALATFKRVLFHEDAIPALEYEYRDSEHIRLIGVIDNEEEEEEEENEG